MLFEFANLFETILNEALPNSSILNCEYVNYPNRLEYLYQFFRKL